MNKNEHLFDLIRSLDKQERRYFRIYASSRTIGERNNCLVLFDAIDAQRSYDEKKLRESLAAERFMNFLAPVKQQLYTLILKSLGSYHSAHDSDALLRGLLHQAHILYRKGLAKACNKLLNRIIKLAEKNEKDHHLVEAYSMRYALLVATKNTGRIRKELDPLLSNVRDALEELQLSFDCRKYQSQSLILAWQEKSFRSEHSLEEIGEVEKKASTLRTPRRIGSQLLINNARTIFADARGDFEAAMSERENAVKMLEEHPELIKDNPIKYYISLYNAAVYLHGREENARALVFADRLVRISGRQIQRSDHRRHFLVGTMIRLAIISRLEEAEGERAPAIEAEQTYRRWQKEFTLHDQVVVGLNFSLLWFNRGDLQAARKWMAEVLNTPGAERTNPEIYFQARVLNLAIHFELGDADYMEHLIRSTYRFLLRRKRIHGFEETLLSFIRKKLPRLNSPRELREALLALKTEMEVLKRDPKESYMFRNFDYVKWLEKKISDLSVRG